METQKYSITLVNNRTENFIWTYDKNRASLSLYDGSYKKFKLDLSEPPLHNGKCVRDVYSSLKSSFQSSNGSSTITIESQSYFSNYRIWIEVTFDDALLETIRNLVMEPTISVQYEFPPYNKTWTTEISLQHNSRQNFRTDLEMMKRQDLELLSVTYSILLKWSDLQPSKNRFDVLQKLLTDKTLADCCILTADKKEIICHGNILAANSDVFQTMLLSGLQESQTKRIEMTDISSQVVNELMSYLYGLEINTKQMTDEMIFDLLRTSHKYNIVSLEEDMLNTLLIKNDTDFTMDVVLPLYYFTVNIEHFQKLCEKSVNILRRNSKALVSSSSYQELLKTNAQEAAKLPWMLLELSSECAKCCNEKKE